MYQSLLDRGIRSGAILYNQGNAFMKAGHRGQAIAAYLEAKRYLPRNPYLDANLRFAQGGARNSPATTTHRAYSVLAESIELRGEVLPGGGRGRDPVFRRPVLVVFLGRGYFEGLSIAFLVVFFGFLHFPQGTTGIALTI